MEQRPFHIFGLLMTLCTFPVQAADTMTPGLYEYAIAINMPGAPAQPPRTSQNCITAQDIASKKNYELPPGQNTDCQVSDSKESGGKFSYKVACSKPQKIDGAVSGSFTSTSMTMDMTMTMPGAPGPMTQSIKAKRIGDCKR